MFWKKKKNPNIDLKMEPKILEQYSMGDMEITRVKTSKPIKATKPGIRIDHMPLK